MEKTIVICLILLASLFVFEEKSVSPIMKQAPALTEPKPSPGAALQAESSRTVSIAQMVANRSHTAMIDVPVIRQLPELYNGCEVTSLSMLLHADGRPVDKMELAEKVTKDPTPFQGTSKRHINQWGDPNDGFVGDITGNKRGYGVYHLPLYKLLQEYVDDRAANLTGKDFATIEWVIDQGQPVVAWTTARFQPTDQWVTWRKGERSIRATFQEHVVLLVGYDESYVYLNDPLSGRKALKVPKQSFIESWKQMGSQALTVLKENHQVVLARSES